MDAQIEPKGSFTYPDCNQKLTATMKDQPQVYDYNDVIFDFVKGDKYVIRRETFRNKQRMQYCCSSFFLKNVNNFGKLGGFDLILNKLAERENPISYKKLLQYAQLMGGLYQVFYRKFAQ